MTAKPAIVVLHSNPDELSDVLDARLDGERVVYVGDADQILPVVRAEDPEVLFSIKQSDFAPHLHREAAHHPSVCWVQVGGSGVDHMLPWQRDDLVVTNGTGVLAPFLADTVTGAMLALNGHFPAYAKSQRAGAWQPVPFVPISEQTLLVVGLGAIGGEVAKRAKALGMTVLGVRRSGGEHPHVDEIHPPEKLPDLVARADFVSLHLRLSDDTRHMFDARMLSHMKPTAHLMNTARGPVVDEKALVAALETGTIAGAYLDVFETEPLPKESPLWYLPNVIITPHASDNIIGWPAKFAELFCDNLKRWRAGEELVNRLSIV